MILTQRSQKRTFLTKEDLYKAYENFNKYMGQKMGVDEFDCPTVHGEGYKVLYIVIERVISFCEEKCRIIIPRIVYQCAATMFLQFYLNIVLRKLDNSEQNLDTSDSTNQLKKRNYITFNANDMRRLLDFEFVGFLSVYLSCKLNNLFLQLNIFLSSMPERYRSMQQDFVDYETTILQVVSFELPFNCVFRAFEGVILQYSLYYKTKCTRNGEIVVDDNESMRNEIVAHLKDVFTKAKKFIFKIICSEFILIYSPSILAYFSLTNYISVEEAINCMRANYFNIDEEVIAKKKNTLLDMHKTFKQLQCDVDREEILDKFTPLTKFMLDDRKASKSILSTVD